MGENEDQLGEWLTSGSARHWMDSIEDKLFSIIKSSKIKIQQMILSDLERWNKK